ncbi:predicted protein [Coccidioides posadasii C735 delta SOWgp]|uniref:Amidase domain-containing protein n=1 Tax=Coccidioides posadasii (strain C735) TaxID=222929 RepID=C5PEV5_COCP7|nr:predicted protein [Coccidioides posadasii C735 delta SOWgp]EER23173.1 predicted protein [Coccidioides posadasii C735 delta SOWgp]|eukprot:XP_003065318.1 predicted protein [Coccidioides posadasii C735 delta SOWgp]
MERIYQTDGYVKYGFPFQALDKDRVNGRTRGPLHGIPFFLKENMTTKYRIETTAGSWALQGSVVPRDAYVVHKSRKAGALLLAKAGMSEWAEIRKMDYSQGYAAFGGQGRIVQPAERNSTVGTKPTVSLTSRSGVPISGHQLGRNVGKGQFATPHIRNNYTLAQKGKTPGEDSAQIAQLLELVDLIKGVVTTIVSGTEITDYERIIPPDG